MTQMSQKKKKNPKGENNRMCCWNTSVTPQCDHGVSLGATVTEGEQEVSQSPAMETLLMTAPQSHCLLGDLCSLWGKMEISNGNEWKFQSLISLILLIPAVATVSAGSKHWCFTWTTTVKSASPSPALCTCVQILPQIIYGLNKGWKAKPTWCKIPWGHCKAVITPSLSHRSFFLFHSRRLCHLMLFTFMLFTLSG